MKNSKKVRKSKNTDNIQGFVATARRTMKLPKHGIERNRDLQAIDFSTCGDFLFISLIVPKI